MNNEILLKLVEERMKLLAQKNAIDEKRKGIDEKIKEIVPDGITIVGNYSIDKHSSTVNRLDTAALKKAYPEIIKVYTKGKFENRFKIVELKEAE